MGDAQCSVNTALSFLLDKDEDGNNCLPPHLMCESVDVRAI